MTEIAATSTPRVAVITCAVLELEIAHFARGLPHIVRVEVLEQGLHNDPPKLRRVLQEAIHRIEDDTEADSIVLGYGLCSRGTEGVQTRRCRLVIARAHDCITHLLGSKERYAEYVAQRPGTYWYSPGWNRHHTPPGPERHAKLRQQYAAEYGEDNAEYLMEHEQHWFTAYDNAAFVHLGVGDLDRELAFTRACADWLGWRCDHQCGDPSLLQSLLAGPWDDERFLVLEPGETFRMSTDARVIEKRTSHGQHPD